MNLRKNVPVPVVIPTAAGCERCTPAEACEFLKISRQTLRRYTAEGRITVHRYSSQKLIYLKSALDQFLDDMKVEAA
ncbi:MAG TPA: helix-turn-helix domain-containing protein [Nitrososphaera sp.]|nr:helix-turn-helix domain-containing protein [Nitrososphaera sp.]